MAKHLIISFKDCLIHCYNGLMISRGVDEDSKADLKEAYDRMSAGGRVPPEQDGLELFVFGTFDDNTGKINLYDDPEYLTTLRAKQEVAK